MQYTISYYARVKHYKSKLEADRKSLGPEIQADADESRLHGGRDNRRSLRSADSTSGSLRGKQFVMRRVTLTGLYLCYSTHPIEIYDREILLIVRRNR